MAPKPQYSAGTIPVAFRHGNCLSIMVARVDGNPSHDQYGDRLKQTGDTLETTLDKIRMWLADLPQRQN